MTITYPQIINGAQTVNALYDSYQDMLKAKTRKLHGNEKEATEEIRKHFKRIKIIFRVITDNDKDGKKNTEFENKVIQYNNSQNSVKVTDFYANEREQIDIQRIMADYGYFYEIKRGDRKYLESNPREKQNAIYGNRQKDGQIITKITQFNKEKFDEKTYG